MRNAECGLPNAECGVTHSSSHRKDDICSKDRNEKDTQTNYRDMVKYMDKCVGRILDCLQEHRLERRTVVMFTTDNGTNRKIRYRYRGQELIGKKGHGRPI